MFNICIKILIIVLSLWKQAMSCDKIDCILSFSVGKTCNYVILMAQLYTQGKCHGIHAFVVQIRSLTDHKPMPGTVQNFNMWLLL